MSGLTEREHGVKASNLGQARRRTAKRVSELLTHRSSRCVALLGLSLSVACAAEQKQPAPPPPPYQPPAAPAADPYLRISSAETGPPPSWIDLGVAPKFENGALGLDAQAGDWSEKAYLALSHYGVLALDLEQGFRGVMKAPAGVVKRAMLVGDGSVVLLAMESGELYQAASLDAAVRGEFTKLNQLAGAEHWDARGKRVVAAGSTDDADKLWISQDQGKTFREGPALPPEVRKLVVRKDGTMAVEIHDFKVWVSDGYRAFAQAKLKAPEATGSGREYLSRVGVLRRQGDALVYDVGCPAKALGKTQWTWVDFNSRRPSLFTGWPGASVEPVLPKIPTANEPGDCDGLLGGLLGNLGKGGAFALAHAETQPPHGAVTAMALGDAVCSLTDSEEKSRTVTVVGTKGEPSREVVEKYRECKPGAKLKRWGSVGIATKTGLLGVPVPPGCYLQSVSSSIGLHLVSCQQVDTAGKTSSSLGVALPDGIRLETALPGVSVSAFSGYSYAADGTLVAKVELNDQRRYYLRSPAAPGAGRWHPLPAEAISAKALPGGRALIALPGPTPTDLGLALHTPAGLQPLPTVALGQNALGWAVTGDGRLKLWLHPRLTHADQKPAPAEAPMQAYFVTQVGGLVPAAE